LTLPNLLAFMELQAMSIARRQSPSVAGRAVLESWTAGAAAWRTASTELRDSAGR
jgi:hypothetical protein